MPVKIGTTEGMSKGEMLRLIESFPDDVIFKINDSQEPCSDCNCGGQDAEDHIWFNRQGLVVYLKSANLPDVNKEERAKHDRAHAVISRAQEDYLVTKESVDMLDDFLNRPTGAKTRAAIKKSKSKDKTVKAGHDSKLVAHPDSELPPLK